MLRMFLILFFALIESSGVWGFQQGEELPTAQPVTIIADDGLTLVGDYFLSATDSDLPHPAVLLLHMIGSSRESWLPLIPDLQKAGYHVLAVDLRGQGDTS